MVKALGQFGVDGNGCGAAAAFLGLAAVPFIREKSFEGDEKKSAKSSSLALHGIEVALLQQPEEKLLREVFGVLRCVTSPAGEGVKRIPISRAKFFEAG